MQSRVVHYFMETSEPLYSLFSWHFMAVNDSV